MDNFEKSAAVFDSKIEHHSRTVIDLERLVALKKLKACNSEKRDLMEELKNKDKELFELRHQHQMTLKALNEKQTELNTIINYVRIRDINEIHKNQMKVKDNMSYELQRKLYQREASLDDINVSQSTAPQHLESEIRRLDLLFKKKDEQLSDQTEQAKETVKTFRQTEIELTGIITLLKSKNSLLEMDKCNLDKILRCKMTEIKDINKLLAHALKDSDELRYQLQQVLKEKEDKEFELNHIISSLQMKMKALEKEIIHTNDSNKFLSMEVKERDDQLRQNKYLNDTLHQKEIELDGVYMKHQRDIEVRDMRIKELKAKLVSINSVTNERHEHLEKDLQKKEELLHKLRYHHQQELNQLQDKEEQLERTIISLNTKIQQLQEEKKGYDLKVTYLQGMPQNANMMIHNTTEQPVHYLSKEQDGQLSNLTDQLQITLKQMQETETELDGVLSSQKKQIQNLKTEAEQRVQTIANLNKIVCKYKDTNTEMSDNNKHLEKRLKEKDEQLRTQDAQLNCILKRLHDTENKLSTLERKYQGLEADIEQRDTKVKTMNENLASMKKEMFGRNELHVKQLEDKEILLLKQKDQLQHALTLSREKETKLRESISLLKNQNRFLEEKADRCESEVKRLEKVLDIKCTEMLDSNKSEKKTDNQMSEQKEQPKQFKEIDTSQTKKLRQLESGVEHLEQNVKHLKEMLNNKTVEMKNMIEKNILLESMVKEKDNQLHEQREQLNRSSEALQDKETELGGIIKALKKKCHDLETDIECHDQQKHNLEKKLDKLKSDKSGTKELYEKEVRQISEQNYQLQQALNQSQKTETTLNEIITALKKQNQEKDNQIIEQRDQLKKALEQLGAKKAENEENDMLLKKKIKYLEAELERREQNFKTLEELLNRNELQEKKLKEKDEQNYQLKRTLKELQETESKLVATITATEKEKQGLEKDVDRRDLKIKYLKEMLESTKTEINGEYERLEKNVHEKDKQLSDNRNQLQQVQEKVSKMNELIILLKTQNEEKDNEISDVRDQLQHASKRLDNREDELKEIDDLQKKNLRYLETELDQREQNVRHLQEMLNNKTVEMKQMIEKNILLESMLKGKDNKLHEQSDELNRASEEKETELGGIIKTLKKKCHGYETDIEHRDHQLHDLKKNFDKLKTDQTSRTEHHVKEVSQISEKNNQLQQTVNRLKETEATLNEVIDALKKQNQQKDNRIFEQGVQLKKALDQLGDKRAGTEENEMLLKKKIKYLESELERREQNLKTLEERIKSTNTEMIELRYRNKSLEKMTKENEDVLHEQTNQWRQGIQNLQREIEIRDRKVDNMEEIIKNKKHENSGNEQNKDVRENNQKIVELKDQLKSTLAKLHDTETELDDTKTRLSKAMGDKLTDNNPNITDLSDRNRPTKLAERCAELYDNQWTDAYDILDKHFHTEENVIEALLLILQDSMTFCITKAHEQMEVLERELKFSDQDANGDAPIVVRKLLKDCRKAVAHVAVGSLHKMYVSHLRRSTDKTLRKALEVSSYTTECLEICWFMVIQDPPVAFAPLLTNGSSFNTDLYKPYTSSGTHIDYVVWPALVLHEGGPILSKGVAQGYGKKSKKSTS